MCDRGIGYLIKVGNYWKIAHNVRVKKGEFIVKKCHLGKLSKVLEKIESISRDRPDSLDPNLIQQIKNSLPENTEPEEINAQLSELITNVFNLSKSLGEGWKVTKKTRFGGVWNIQKCPHCDQKIQFLFMKERQYKYVKLQKAKD